MVMPRFFFLLLFGITMAACTDDPDVSENIDTERPFIETEGEWIVFSSGRSGEGDIYAIHPESRETRLLAGTPASEGTVRYDAYGQRVVYHRYEEDPMRAMLVSQGVDLFEDPNGDVAPAWSPVKPQVVYVANRDGQEDLYVAEADGAGEIRLTNDALVERYPAWSPDGAAIVYALRLETGWDLHVIEPLVDAPEPRRLTTDGVYVGHPSWSPDGRFIAFDTLIDGQAEIAMLEVETGVITRLTERAGNDLIPAWSGDSQRIAFGGEPDNAGNWDLWMVDITTRDITRLTSQPAFDGGPVFVPAAVLNSVE